MSHRTLAVPSFIWTLAQLRLCTSVWEPLFFLVGALFQPSQCQVIHHFHAWLAGLGAAHVCGLENAAPDDALLPSLTGQQPTTLVICITRLLTEAHPLILRAALVSPWLIVLMDMHCNLPRR